MPEAIQTPQQNAVQRFRTVLEDPIVQEQFKNALEENAPLFVASLVDVVSNDKILQECSPKDLIREAFKAATLKLPINKGLGFAWIVPFREKGVPKPQMQIGYKATSSSPSVPHSTATSTPISSTKRAKKSR